MVLKKRKSHGSTKSKKSTKKQQKITCPHCGVQHTISQHSSHGKGSFKKIHKTKSKTKKRK